ncbi:MAG: hypothetical protein ABI418_16845 [Jatrophihabitantaceae bacterium]
MAGNSERLWIGGSALGAVVLSAVAWMLVINPELSSASSLKSQTSAAQDQNMLLRQKINRLSADNAKLGETSSKLRTAKAGLPEDAALTDFTRELTAQAAATGVRIDSVTYGGAKSVTGSAATAPRPGSAPVTASPVGQLFSIPVAISVWGSASQLQTFMQDVQRTGARRVLVSTVHLTPAATSATLSIEKLASASIELSVFVAPESAAAQAQLQQQLNKTKSN